MKCLKPVQITPSTFPLSDMPRIFFFDIDNTLLDHNTFTVPPSALTVIDRLHQEGHTIVVATGRSYGHALQFIEPIAADYVITQNGARILKSGKEVLSIPLEAQALNELFGWMAAQGFPYGVNLGESRADKSYISAAVPNATIPLASVNMSYQCDPHSYLHRPVHQAWLFYDEHLDGQMMPEILERFPCFDLVRWHKTGVDVMPATVNKWTGCQWVMQATGFAPEQAVAFGDGLNDIQMLQGVGLGIAMGNAHPELKAVADHVAPALHLDGIAKTIASGIWQR